jgi:hypothetical protein
MVLNAEERKERDKAYYEKNKEHKKEYYEKNKEQIQEYYEKNKEQIKEYNKEYSQTEAGKKSNRINNWKQIGVKSEDYNALYEYYINCKYCENCDIELIEGNYGANKRCLDHCHKTGLFRNVLCHICNIKRRMKREGLRVI